MRGLRRTKNWDLFLLVVAMGVSVNQTCELMNIHRNSPYQLGARDPEFRRKLDLALARQGRCHMADPKFFVHPETLEPLLDANFNRIPRKPLNTLLPWIHEQLVRNPLAHIA